MTGLLAMFLILLLPWVPLCLMWKFSDSDHTIWFFFAFVVGGNAFMFGGGHLVLELLTA